MEKLWYDATVSKLEFGIMQMFTTDAEITIKDKNVSGSELSLRGWMKEKKPSLHSKVRITIEIIE